MQRIIDTHFHEFDTERFTVDWLKAVPVMNRRWLLADFEEACKSDAYAICGAVHVELDTIVSEKEAENDYFCNLFLQKKDFLKAVILYADMASENMQETVQKYLNRPGVAGIRYLLHEDRTPPKTCLTEVFQANVQKLGEMGMHFEACMRPGEMFDLYTLAKACPNTLIVLNHMGLPKVEALDDRDRVSEIEEWKKGIQQLGTLPNVVCKLSGLSSVVIDKIKPLIDTCIESFGEDRIVFATNYPVCNMSISAPEWTQAMLTLFSDKTQDQKDKFFYKNAQRIYKMED